MKLVVDASVALKWVVMEPGSAEAEALLDHDLFAPELLVAECANVLWRRTTRGELTAAVATTASRVLQASGIALVSMAARLDSILALALELGHPAYDCAYVDLAMSLQAPLVTADSRLVTRCRGRRYAEYLRLLGESL